jgi:[protein-PII] uridylyltransferase
MNNSLEKISLNNTISQQDIAHFLQQTSIPNIKVLINSISSQLDDFFSNGAPIEDIICFRAHFIDALLGYLWSENTWSSPQPSIIAVGGYGRGELHPHSDIDLLFLISDKTSTQNTKNIENFVTLLWDLNFKVGHSVRSVFECIELAQNDITVITNLTESRFLDGNKTLFQNLTYQLSSQDFWPSEQFFSAKQHEQKDRHQQYNNTEYNLEPNIKECPGGLRDIHTIKWVTTRHFKTQNLDVLLEHNYLNAHELKTLQEGYLYLWKVRYALHNYYNRAEERLLFEAQISIAKLLGYKDNHCKLAVEQFMQDFYRWAFKLASLNIIIMQLFSENIVSDHPQHNIVQIDEDFLLINSFIDFKKDRVASDPSLIFTLFYNIAINHEIEGIRSHAIRIIQDSLYLIDEKFRSTPEHHKLFLEILKSPTRAALTLTKMKRLGVLSAYIPVFEQIIGQTQHDLFHIYTVDTHTILVLMNISKLSRPETKIKHPYIYNVLKKIEKIELLYLAALFHDIAKGRGGDHSELGAHDAFQFCRQIGLSRRDSNLVSWLVSKHLLMSSTAQRKDISDPEIIREYALEMGDSIHLDYLYILTVSDIHATNKTLWNSWRASLLQQLHASTERALWRGLEHYLDRSEWIADTQHQALAALQKCGMNSEQARIIWDEPNNDFFLREHYSSIIRYTLALSEHLSSPSNKNSYVSITHPESDNQLGASEIFIYTSSHCNLFAVITAVLEQTGLTVHDARIYETKSHNSLYIFHVLNIDNQPLNKDSETSNKIISRIQHELLAPEKFADIVKKRTSRQLKHFSTPTSALIQFDFIRECNVLEVISPDRPGLLARITRIFLDYNIDLIGAKIATLGERVEDIFFITSHNKNKTISHDTAREIERAICDTLDNQNS